MISSDPLGPVLDLGGGQSQTRFSLGLLGAFVVHAALGATALANLLELEAFVALLNGKMQDLLILAYDIEVEPPKPEPKPEPEPEPKPDDIKPVAPPRDTAASPPPPAAQAAKILAAEPDPDAPLDLTDQGFVTGSGDRFAGGVTSSKGTSKTAQRDPTAQGNGEPGPRAPVVGPAASERDLSRIPSLTSDTWRSCPFPKQAEVEQIHYARPRITVTVGPDGRALKASVVSDPGYGFGQAAVACALRKTYKPALDRSGRAIAQTTPPITVTFTR